MWMHLKIGDAHLVNRVNWGIIDTLAPEEKWF